MKILITGACGHIGSHFVENLYKIKKVKKAILVDNLKSNCFNSLFNINHKNKVEFFLKDLNDPKSLNQFKNINIVFHLASMTNAAKSFGIEKEMYSNNLNCFNTVVKFCEKTGAKLAHLSSTSVYGKQTELVDETCEKKYLKPQSPYAKIKILEENHRKIKVQRRKITQKHVGNPQNLPGVLIGGPTTKQLSNIRQKNGISRRKIVNPPEGRKFFRT